MAFLDILNLFTAISFIIYGISCLFSTQMQKEFIRFGLPQYRILTGILQIVGAVGLLFGLHFYMIAFYAGLGLGVLMLMGFVTRLVIRDGLVESSPAFIFMLVNFYLAYGYFGRV